MLKSIVHSLIFLSNVLLTLQKKHGKDIDTKEYPFLVSVMVKSETGYVRYGGGTIVKLDVVLTSCRVVGFLDENGRTRPLAPENVRVAAGNQKLYTADKSQQVRKVRKNILDQRCNLSNSTYDLAILTLKSRFTENQYVKTWQIFSYDRDSAKEEFDRLTGFRATCDQALWSDYPSIENRGPNSKELWLSEGHVKIIPDSQCRKNFCIFSNTLCNYRFAENGQFCAVAENGTVPCMEDLGTPLVCHGSVFGIVSFGSCSACKPSVYVNPVTMLDAVQKYSSQRSNAVTIRCAKFFHLIGITKYFLPATMIVYLCTLCQIECFQSY